MSVINGFFIIIMLLFLIYMAYRLFIKRKLIMLLLAGTQIFAILIAVLCFVNDVQDLNIIQACYILLGVIIPCYFIICDYVKMMKKIKEKGVYEGFIVKEPSESGIEKNTDIHSLRINPILKENQIAAIISGLDLNKDNILKNVKKNLIHAHIFISNKDYSSAFGIYNQIVKIISNSPQLYYNHGNLCYYLGNYSEAINSYKKVLELKEDHTVYYNLGNAFFKYKKYNKAIEHYEKALELNPAFIDAQENKTLSLAGMGESGKALEYFKNINGQDENNYKVHFIFSILLSDIGKYEESEEEIKKCIKLDSKCAGGFEELGRILLKQNKLNEALEAYENLIILTPDDFTGYYKKGNCYYKLGMRKEAVEYFKKSIELKPDNYKSYFNMAVALDEMGSRNEAIEMFNKAIEIKPDFVDAYNNLGIILSYMGRNNEAIQIYEEGIRRNPEEFSMFFNMGIMLAEAGRNHEAVAAYRNALKIKPDECEINNYLGAALTKIRSYNDAIEAYKNALMVKPSDSELLYNIASVYSLLGRYDIAKDNLRKAIEINDRFKNDAKNNRAFDGMRSKSDFRELVS